MSSFIFNFEIAIPLSPLTEYSEFFQAIARRWGNKSDP